MKMLGRTLPLAAVLAISAGFASQAAAQEPGEPEALDRERITQFVYAHIDINEARDEFHGKVARVHDEEGRQRAREEVEARIDEILEEQEMTREQYDDITLRISLDGDLRTLFEEVLAEVEAERTGDSRP